MKVSELINIAHNLWHKSARRDVSKAFNDCAAELEFIVRQSNKELKKIDPDVRDQFICPYCGLYNNGSGDYKPCGDCGVY